MAQKRRLWNPFRKSVGVKANKTPTAVGGRKASPTEVFGSISDVLKQTDDLTKSARSRSSYDNYDQTFDLYDSMVKLDPELNGAVRSVSLTANNYEIDYKGAKNARIRNAIKQLVHDTDFDDILISAMRNLMVYGNDINKLVGKAGVGITKVQSLPAKQITIMDNRVDVRETTSSGYTGHITEDNPVMNANYYLFRENTVDTQVFDSDEIWHIKIDYRSNWFQDRLGRKTYGIWGASRFSALKQPIRAKYNSINNRVALEDSLTKQYITIGMEAVEHIQDPAEQQERLKSIMNDVAKLLETLDGDQIPILPSYIDIHHVDLKNAIPDASSFLDSVNADIAAVLHVPRVASGQERGSTFAATYNANVWAVSAIQRLQGVLTESVHGLFSKHLNLLGIPHKHDDLPFLTFLPIDEETPLNRMRRATMGYDSGLLSDNQALHIVGLKSDGGEKKQQSGNFNKGELPREKSTENESKPDNDS
ncbi:MAG: hypothetical protein CMC15_14945 [Flavobacteriaceae bacterium]|nr:hypothetical protein [Flavobacteriaceae bacterium]